MSIIDQIFILRQILVKHYELYIEIHIVFVNFKQAYANIIREELWNSLRKFRIPKKYINLIKMCNNSTVKKCEWRRK